MYPVQKPSNTLVVAQGTVAMNSVRGENFQRRSACIVSDDFTALGPEEEAGLEGDLAMEED
jgi:hypothetical protein